MPNPISAIPAKPPHRRKRRASAPPAAPAALTLISATYDGGGPELTLVFDRPINIDAYDGSQIIVDAQVDHRVYDGTNGVSLIGPDTVLIGLNDAAGSSGTEVLLTVGAANGIVAVDDAQMWGGCTDLVLPFA